MTGTAEGVIKAKEATKENNSQSKKRGHASNGHKVMVPGIEQDVKGVNEVASEMDARGKNADGYHSNGNRNHEKR